MGFERCHPAVNLICFTAVSAGTAAYHHPVFLALSFLRACAYSIRRNRGKAAASALCYFGQVSPRRIWEQVKPLTILFYAGYTVLCRMSLGLELWTQYQFKKARDAI